MDRVLAGFYLDVLERVAHHSNKHVNEHDDCDTVIRHEQRLSHVLCIGLNVSLTYRAQLGQTEQRPEERRVALY